jgi:predicted nucleic acid-binding protein
MKNIFVDTNILVDLIADRKPFSKNAIGIFKLAEAKKINLFTSSHSIATTYYLLSKYVDQKKLREVLLGLMEVVQVVEIDQQILKQALMSNFKDVEDAIQLFCASSKSKMECIITRNLKDFKTSRIKVLSPEVFLEQKNK